MKRWTYVTACSAAELILVRINVCATLAPRVVRRQTIACADGYICLLLLLLLFIIVSVSGESPLVCSSYKRIIKTCVRFQTDIPKRQKRRRVVSSGGSVVLSLVFRSHPFRCPVPDIQQGCEKKLCCFKCLTPTTHMYLWCGTTAK